MILVYLALGYLAALVAFASSHHPNPVLFFLGIGGSLLVYIVALELLWKERAPHAFVADVLATVPALMAGAAGSLLTPVVGVPAFLVVWFFVFRTVMGGIQLPAR